MEKEEETDREEKPEMMHQEASFHQAVAGSRAAKEAAESGNDPAQVDALGEVASGGKRIGEVIFSRPSTKTIFAVPGIIELLGDREITAGHNTGLFLYCFVDPAAAYRLAKVERSEAAIEELLDLAEGLMVELDSEENVEAATEWCNETFQRLNGVKKRSTVEGPGSSKSRSTVSQISPVPATEAVDRDGSSRSSMS